MLIDDIRTDILSAQNEGDVTRHCALAKLVQQVGEDSRNHKVVDNILKEISAQEEVLAQLEEDHPGIQVIGQVISLLRAKLPAPLSEEETIGVLRTLCQKYRGNKDLTIAEAIDVLGVNRDVVLSQYGKVWGEVKKEIEEEWNKKE